MQSGTCCPKVRLRQTTRSAITPSRKPKYEKMASGAEAPWKSCIFGGVETPPFRYFFRLGLISSTYWPSFRLSLAPKTVEVFLKRQIRSSLFGTALTAKPCMLDMDFGEC